MALMAGVATLSAAPVSIGFEVPQGTYVPTPGVTQELTNQFSSLGIIFQDISSPGRGAIAGQCGPGNGLVSLFGFGADFAGCGDTTPNLDIVFVDPSNPLNPAYTTSFSILNTDGTLQLSAYDIFGNLLGSTSNFSGTLSLSGIGQIARVNLLSLDQNPTTMDDLNFEAVTPFAPVPEPGTWGLLTLGFGALALRKRR
ncbi:MAG: PEP-CTERM sorting domain-containing protein [Acidobacteria bacterium]|nr:PEP-CTERM sorting domain-containing protein [Acidobacteriota bacterium]